MAEKIKLSKNFLKKFQNEPFIDFEDENDLPADFFITDPYVYINDFGEFYVKGKILTYDERGDVIKERKGLLRFIPKISEEELKKLEFGDYLLLKAKWEKGRIDYAALQI